jgi:hypothetical protein
MTEEPVGGEEVFRRPTVRRTIRNSNNWLPGWLLAVGLPLLAGFLDPLFLLYDRPRQPDDTFAVLFPFTLGGAAVSLLAYIFLVRPCVDITEQHFILRNPVRETAVPRAGCSLAHGLIMGFPKIVAADGGRHTAWGAENEPQLFLQHSQPLVGAALPVVTRRRRLGPAIPLMAALWAIYCIVGAIAW